MATLITDTLIPMTLGIGLGRRVIPLRLIALGIFLSVLPDADVIAFYVGIPYASPFGHRGFTHSIFVSGFVALLSALFYRTLHSKRLAVFLYVFVSMVSHPLLDALTDGGLGVALFWPFNTEHFFFPRQIVAVSPIGKSFFSERGLWVMQSELNTIWLPAFLIGLGLYLIRKTVRQL